jgi:hypothetical protein
MTGHQTVEKFAKRPGFRLIDCIEVAFPVYAVFTFGYLQFSANE